MSAFDSEPNTVSRWLRAWKAVRNNPSSPSYAAVVRVLNHPMVPSTVRTREQVPDMARVPEAAKMSFVDAEAFLRPSTTPLAQPYKPHFTRQRVGGAALSLIAFVGFMVFVSRDAPHPVSSSPAAGGESARMTVARDVLAKAGALCPMHEESPHLVVECRVEIAPGERLALAQSIADADAIVAGEARIIYFYLPNRSQFAQADPLHGVRLRE